jgi:tetratricopeptide (TPR) repeat protein
MSRDEALAQAEAALQRAIDLDPTLRHSHQALARIRRGKGDFEGAAREYRRAREVDPKWLGPEIYLLDTGRYDEAVAAARQAARNDPWNYAVQILPGNVCFWAGRYDESIEHLKKATDLDPDNPIGHYELAWNFVKKGMADKAVEECDRATALRQRKQPGAVITECGWVYAATGRRAKAVEIASRLPVAPDRRETTFTSMADARGFKALAKIHAWLGDRDRALVYLQQASDVGMPLANDAMFPDDLKADPRFRELARKQRGFPPATGALAENRTRAGRVAAAGTI